MAVLYSDTRPHHEDDAVSDPLPPLTEAIIHAVCRLVDDHKQPREPSHSQLTWAVARAGLEDVDRAENPRPAGKEKRLRALLTWTYERDITKGQLLVSYVVPMIQGCSGFMAGSPNYVGENPIATARQVFADEGWELAPNGDLHPLLLDGVPSVEADRILRTYVRRLRRNPDDSPLVVGTSKDLLEATAKHAVLERWGSVPEANFPGLLGQAFTAVGLATRFDTRRPGEAAQRDIERSYYDLGCAVNKLRNKEGTGKGSAFLPTVTPSQARAACQAMALISDYLLDALNE